MAVPRPRLPARPQLPAPLARAGRALGLPVGEIARYWAQEAPSIRRGTAALGVGMVATLIAGTVLGAARAPLAAHPGLLVLIPAAIGMRGSIFGALAARLGTGMLTGEFEPELRRRSFLGRQLEATTLLTVASSVEAGLLAWVISAGLGIEAVPPLDLVAVSIVAGILSSVVLAFVTIALARRADIRGWSMDDVGAPTLTATGDLITLPALLVATLLLSEEAVALSIGALAVVAGALSVWRGWTHPEAAIRRVVRESLVVLTIAVMVDVLAGTVMETRSAQLLAAPALLVLIPPFVANCGSLGGMLGSRLASKLHVGSIEPNLLPGKDAALDFSLTALLAFLAFVGVGAVGWMASLLAGLTPPNLLTMVGISLTGGVFATALLAVVAYAAAAVSFRSGFDPDNHGIPIVTAAMDLLGILCLVGAIGLLQVG